MDAVGFVASLTQLAGTGLALSISLYEYASGVSTAPKRLNDLADEIKLTSSVLEHLSDVFAEAAHRAFVRPGAFKTAMEAISGCSEVFDEMQGLIDNGRKPIGRMAVPFKGPRFVLLNARLASLKSTLQLLLQVLQYAQSMDRDPVGMPGTSSENSDLSQFYTPLEARREAERRYQRTQEYVSSRRSGILRDPREPRAPKADGDMTSPSSSEERSGRVASPHIDVPTLPTVTLAALGAGADGPESQPRNQVQAPTPKSGQVEDLGGIASLIMETLTCCIAAMTGTCFPRSHRSKTAPIEFGPVQRVPVPVQHQDTHPANDIPSRVFDTDITQPCLQLPSESRSTRRSYIRVGPADFAMRVLSLHPDDPSFLERLGVSMPEYHKMEALGPEAITELQYSQLNGGLPPAELLETLLQRTVLS